MNLGCLVVESSETPQALQNGKRDEEYRISDTFENNLIRSFPLTLTSSEPTQLHMLLILFRKPEPVCLSALGETGWTPGFSPLCPERQRNNLGLLFGL